MKSNNLILCLLLFFITFTSCEDDNSSILSVAPTSKDVSSVSGSFTITITSNTNWIIETDKSWCTATPSSGNGNSTITIDYNNNSELVSRTANINISAEHAETVVVVLTQEIRNSASNPNFGNFNSDPFGISDQASGINFIDIDNDEDLDAFTVSGYGTSYFENIGTKNNPNFKISGSPIESSHQALGISLVDIDDDGDYDVFTISGYGVDYMKNNGTKNVPAFSNLVSSPFGISDQAWSLDFADMDNDSDYDLFTVSGYGTSYFENIGTKNNPNFKISSSPIESSHQALGISLVDIDDDGDYDVFTSSGYGTSYFKNTGNKYEPNFSGSTSSPFGISMEALGLDFVDIDYDMDKDVFSVSGYGTSFLENLNF